MRSKQPPKRFLRLDARRLAICLGTPLILAIPVQLALGCSPLVLLFAVITCSVGLFAFVVMGAYNLGGWLSLFYILGNVLVALYAKTLLGQPLDSHLFAPFDSFLVLVISSGTLVVALLVVQRVRLGKPLLRAVEDPWTLARLSWGTFVLGVMFWFLNQYLERPDGAGFGGFAVFRDLLIMAVIARTAMLLQLSGDRRSLDLRLVFILGVAVFLGLLSNSKTYAAYPVVSYFVTVLFFRRGISLRWLVSIVVGGTIFVVILTPMIQAWRYLDQKQLDLPGRVASIVTGLQAFEHGRFGHYIDLAQIQFRGGYYDYFGGDGRGQMILGRYASVQQIDPVIAEVNRQGALGGSVIWPAFTRLLPSFIYPDKPKYIEAYHIAAHLGLIDPAGGKYPTVPLAGQAYAGYGWTGVLLISLATFLGFLLALKKIGWSLHRNVYAVFFLVDFVIVYGGQGTLGQYAGFVLRSAPLLVLVFWTLVKSSNIRFTRSVNEHFTST